MRLHSILRGLFRMPARWTIRRLPYPPDAAAGGDTAARRSGGLRVEPRARQALAVLALAAALALALLGIRGIWDPDEGRYTNVAVNMVESGDWMTPRLSEDIDHWTKPPLTYWAIASSIRVFGLNPWAARAPVALSYLLCVLLAWCIGRRLAGSAAPAAALVYATMLLPWAASQFVTTDTLLTLFETLAMWAYIEARAAPRHASWWIVLAWVACALAFMTKGPPALLPLLVMATVDVLVPGRHRTFSVAGIGTFLVLALPWFVVVSIRHPGLAHYFLADEVAARFASDAFHRNGEWYGWLVVYGPTLAIGSLPWTPDAWRWLRAFPRRFSAWRSTRDPELRPAILLGAWIGIPLLVLCIARSRLPLYLLPTMVPIAVAVAMERQASARRTLPAWPAVLAWGALLLAVAASSAAWPSHKNAGAWAREIERRTTGPVTEVIFVDDMARYGLRLHLDAEVEKVSLGELPDGRPRIDRTYDGDFAGVLRQGAGQPGAVFICKADAWDAVRHAVARRGLVPVVLGAPYRDRIIFRVQGGAEP
jgi:4-amino-4-deoxy-L-arabinose transferase-like glycosyltransferase